MDDQLFLLQSEDEKDGPHDGRGRIEATPPEHTLDGLSTAAASQSHHDR